MKQYNKEIEMLVRSIDKPIIEKIDDRFIEPNKRMPIELEPIMMERFNELRIKFNLF